MENKPSERSDSSSNLMVRNDFSESNSLQLFPSIPALSEAASYIAETTSLFTSCFGVPSGAVAAESHELLELTSEPDNIPLRNSWSRVSIQENDQGTSSRLQVGVGTSSSTGENEPRRQNNILLNGPSMFRDLVEKARKTVHGSADDIGWLQRSADLPSIEDGTTRYLEILENVRKDEHKLPDSVVYLLIPGLFSNHGPMYFVSTKTAFSKMGLTCHIAKIHSEASVENNARVIKEYIEEIFWGSQKRVLLFGHSKGGIDAAAALSLYWPDLKDKVAGLALAQSPYGGSPIASDILREGQLGDYVKLRSLMEILACKVLKGDLLALEDLTYERRKEFIRKHPLPKELPLVSFHTEAGITPAVLTTLSHVAHAELPVIAPLAEGQLSKVPVVMPLGAAMAACAQLLQVRYGEKSDGLVTRRDAEVPGSVVVRPDSKFDHAWMVYSALTNDATEANSSQVCEALLTLLVEVGLKKRHEMSRKDE